LMPDVGLSSLAGALEGAGGDDEDSEDGGAGGASSGGTGGSGDTDDLVEEAEEGAASVADSAVPETVPGLYGNEFEIQIDVSRLPRIEDFSLFVSADGATPDHLSDVKSVAYFVRQKSTSVVNGADLASSPGGLVRREMARAATLFASQNGGLLDSDQRIEPFAPEVVGVQFRYFDGLEFFAEWDSTAREGLPMAVEITIEIAPLAEEYVERPSGAVSLAEEPAHLIYQLLVHLPAAEPTDEETMASEQDEEDAAADEEAAASEESSDSDASGGGASGPSSGASGAGGPSGPGGGGQP